MGLFYTTQTGDLGTSGSRAQMRSAFQPIPQNPNPGGGTAAEFAANAKAQSETPAPEVYTDDDLTVEQNALKAIAPRSGANVVAVATGDWSSSSTWYNTDTETQAVPVEGDDVLIPQGVTVTYDVAAASSVALNTLRVDGTLTTDHSADRTYKFKDRGFVYIDHTGLFECGTDVSPVPYTTSITFEWDCSTDMSRTGDMMKLARGLTTYGGGVSICGAEKVHFARTPVEPEASDTSFTLDRAVTGWEVGDELLVVGTRRRDWDTGSWVEPENETVTITNIDNSTPSAPVVNFTPALTYPHPHAVYGWTLAYDALTVPFTEGETIDGGNSEIVGIDFDGTTGVLYLKGNPSGITDNDTITSSGGGSATANGDPLNPLTCVVTNMTRNIVFKPTQGAATEQQRRPHTLFKGDGGIYVRWADAQSMGRTDHLYQDLMDRGQYQLGDNTIHDNARGAWNGPDIMSARLLDFTYSGDPNFGVQFRGKNKTKEKLTFQSGGEAYVADYEDNGDGTGTVLLIKIEGTIANGDTVTSNYGAAFTAASDPYTFMPSATCNFQGRYPWHIHRCGPQNPESAAIEFTGLVARDTKAWAYVHHDSHADISKCIAVGYVSAGIAAEGGGSIGLWSDNVMCGMRENVGNYTETQTKTGGDDFGNRGHGYWCHSRAVRHLRNIAANNGAGWLWSTRTKSAQQTNVYAAAVSNGDVIFYGYANNPDQQVGVQRSIIEQFEDCEAWCCEIGAAVAKQQPKQLHDKSTFLDGFVSWECKQGSTFQYTGHYTLKNFKHYGQANGSSLAISLYRNAIDMTVSEPLIVGYSKGIRMTTTGTFPWNKRIGHVLVSPKIYGASENYTNLTLNDGEPEITAFPYNFFPAEDGLPDMKFIDVSTVGSDGVSHAYVEDQMIYSNANETFVIIGTLTDSLGSKFRHVGTAEEALGDGNMVLNLQSEANDGSQAGAATTGGSFGSSTALRSDQMAALMLRDGVYRGAVDGDERILLIRDGASDRYHGTFHEFYTPVALRMSQSQFDAIMGPDWSSGSLDNGVIGTVGGQDFSGFNPAGTPGLT